jgi:hypothetical protein
VVSRLPSSAKNKWCCRDIYECENEKQVLTRKQTLAISFTNISLTVSNTAVVGPYRFEEFKGSVYRELGFQQWTNNPSDATFLGQNQGCHQKCECARGATKSVGFAWRSCFLSEIPRATCGSIDIFHLYEEWRSVERDPLYLAAHATAKLPKVWQGSTFGCQEPCYYHPDERPEDDGEGVTLREMFESRFLPGQTCRIGECHFK